jgi:c-di-GMP-binding flagellar brake protein YcgR
MTDPNSERIGKSVRKHVRIASRLEVQFFIEGDEGSRAYTAETKDISRGGACLIVLDGKEELIEKVDQGMPRLKVKLFIHDDGKAMDIQSKTMWISSKVGWFMTPSSADMPVLIGMAFEGLSREDNEKIDSYIEEVINSDRQSLQEIKKRIASKLNRK